jgi:glutaconyl-CoA/methylmalonyl-CoA decarboxylase subunit gamma
MKKQFRITVNGKAYEVVAEMLDSAPVAGQAVQPIIPAASAVISAPVAAPVAAPAAPKPAGGASGGGGAVNSPLAGKVVSIDKPVGAAVAAGEQVITLEAMKMNTVVTSAVAGTVQSVTVHPGDSVEEGQLLMVVG